MTDWGWSPQLGSWSLDKHGLPTAPQRVAVATSDVAKGQYEFWRQIAFPDFEADPLDAAGEAAFTAKGNGLIWNHADLFVSESSTLSGKRSRRHIAADGLDSLSIGVVLDGRRNSEQEGDDGISTSAGGLFVYDASRPSTVEWSDHKVVYLVVRRPMLRAALGQDVPTPSSMMKRLAASPLRSVLRDQILSVARHSMSARADDQTFILSQAAQLAIYALSQQPDEDQDGERPDGAVLSAATAYIEAHLAEPNLSIDQVARAVKCSRATLYRIFSAEGIGVAEYIRDCRLDRARALIERAHPDVPISEIAVRCGIYDTANFSRMFRRRFGLSPSSLREN